MPKEHHLKAFNDYLQGLDKFSRGSKKTYLSVIIQYLKHIHHTKTDIPMDELNEMGKRRPKELQEIVSQIPIEEVTPESMNLYVNYVKGHLSMSSQVSTLFALRKYLYFIQREYGNNTYEYYKDIKRNNEGIPKAEREENPLIPKRVDTTTRRPLSDEELNKLFEVSKHNLRDYAILKIAYYTAQRIDTISLMELPNLDRTNRRITVYAKGKDGKPRIYTIPIDKEAIECIDAYLKAREPTVEGYIVDNWGIKRYHRDAIFLNGEGQRFTKMGMTNMLKRYAFKSGIKRSIFFHLFRHTRCDVLTRQGFTEKQIMLQTGHLQQQSVQRYINPDLERTQKLFEEANEKERNIPKESTPQETPQPQPQTHSENKTDKYIALLEKGLIDKDTFRQLMSLPNPNSSPLPGGDLGYHQ
jgi:site-specific recombinase XerD